MAAPGVHVPHAVARLLLGWGCGLHVARQQVMAGGAACRCIRVAAATVS